jgi:hypothetical protein
MLVIKQLLFNQNISFVGSTGLIIVERSPSPETSTLCGTMIGVISSYIPEAMNILVPGRAAFTAARTVLLGREIA